MSKRKELEESNENSIKAIDDSIRSIKEQSDFIPSLYERKMELEANRNLINSADETEIDEMYSKLLPLQKQDEKSYTLLSNKLGEVKSVLPSIFSSTSGTASIYMDTAYSLSPALSQEISLVYKDVIEYKSHKSELPKRLTQLYSNLGDLFSSVHDNVDKAKNGVMTVKQAVSDMRDVLNQIWANLADRAVKRYPENWKGINHKQFESTAHRKIVAICLIDNPENQVKFHLLLDSMRSLFVEMSDTSIGKNPLSQDHVKLDEFYTRWITLIDGVTGLIDWDV